MEEVVKPPHAVQSTVFGGWAGRSVFLTGHTGFKGGWLALWLARLGARVTGYSLQPPTKPNLFELTHVQGSTNSVIADVRDLDCLAKEMRESQPEVVFHLAAQSLVRHSYAEPIDTYAVNVMGTANVLEAVRRTPSVRAVVIVTTDKCYENREWAWGYRENDRLGGHDPYSNSKACAELVTQAFRDSFFSGTQVHPVAVASARAGNVIGGGDWALDRLLPDFVRAIMEGRPVRIRRPDAVRPWQHVLDPLSGYLRLAERLLAEGERWAEGWNFGPDHADARNVKWVVERFTRLWGGDARWEADSGAHPHETGMLRLDISKARQKLGWRPTWDVERALERTVEWYRSYAKGADVKALTAAQIADFEVQSKLLEQAT
jgi:CDP-glucose 4,6-dehydratase